MASPFDIVKSFTQTKDNLCELESEFNKEYNSFMINRILSNSAQHILFANEMNKSIAIDKKLQYDFYRMGIPKSKSYTKYIKKDALTSNQEHLDYICSSMNVSMKRGLEIYGIIGPEVVQAELDSRGGRVK